jgi:hypothetical protein
MTKKNLPFGHIMQVARTNSELDGQLARVIGVSSRGILDLYILEWLCGAVKIMPDGMVYAAFVMPECCLDEP